MDAMLALFVTAAIVCFERALFEPDPIAVIDLLSLQELRAVFAVPPGFALRGHLLTMEDGGVRGACATFLWFTIAALMIGLGILSKGVLGIALPGLAIALYLIARGHIATLIRPALIAAFTAGLAIGLAWYAAGYAIDGWQFLHWQLAMNLWSRILPVEAGGAGYCAHPFWYFAPVTLAGFVPWSLYLPAAAIGLWTRRRSLPLPIVFALCWFAAIFLFFSASTGKCLIYILPVFPPLAIIIGFIIDSLEKDAEAEAAADFDPPVEAADTVAAAAFMIGTAVIAAGAAVIVLAAIVIMVHGLTAQLLLHLHPTDRRFLAIFASLAARLAPSLLLWLVAFAAGIAVVIAGLRKRGPEFQAIGTGVIAVAGGLFWFGVMNPALAKIETLRDFAHQVAATVPQGTMAGHIGLGDCDLNFYSPAPLPDVFHFRCDDADFLPRYIVIREDAFDAMTPAQRACLKPILESAPVDSNGPRLLLKRTN
jgi:4-amino-4-deoxy-L-arabinose transferase-like glycosyltransferase